MNLFYGVCENHGRVLVPENIFNVAIESGSFKTYDECCSECKIAFKKTGHLIIKKSKHKCGPKCEAATSNKCECECGGKNHGKLN